MSDPEQANPTERTPRQPVRQDEAGQDEAGQDRLAQSRGPDSSRQEPAHDTAGLDLARSVARAIRGVAPRRPKSGARSARRPRSAELSGAHPDARDPALVGSVVDKLVTESGWATDLAVHGVFARWPAIVGSELAAHCTPESYRDCRLTVRTDSTAWATELKLLAPNVVRRMNEELGHGTVLIIDVLGPDGPSWSKGRRSVRGGRGPRDTYG